MDATQAQDHLQMVDRILAEADRQVRLMPQPFIAFGLAGGVADLIAQLVFVNGADSRLFWISAAAWFMAVGITIFSARRLRALKQRWTVLDQQLYLLFQVIWIVTLATAFGGQPHVFFNWAGAAIWNLVYALALIYVRTQGNRYTFVGGIVLAASIIGANFASPYAGFMLAAGMWIGMAGTGFALLITQRR